MFENVIINCNKNMYFVKIHIFSLKIAREREKEKEKNAKRNMREFSSIFPHGKNGSLKHNSWTIKFLPSRHPPLEVSNTPNDARRARKKYQEKLVGEGCIVKVNL